MPTRPALVMMRLLGLATILLSMIVVYYGPTQPLILTFLATSTALVVLVLKMIWCPTPTFEESLGGEV
jgi:hypothetical protein